jgi:hypothetical protein
MKDCPNCAHPMAKHSYIIGCFHDQIIDPQTGKVTFDGCPCPLAMSLRNAGKESE